MKNNKCNKARGHCASNDNDFVTVVANFIASIVKCSAGLFDTVFYQKAMKRTAY
jgi:hypothetical protein